MTRGGARPGAGRLPELSRPVTVNLNLEQHHARILDDVQRQLGAANRSEAMRRLLDLIEPNIAQLQWEK